MGHLKNTRSGWENERLAEFLLSRISFIANPAKTSDDVGTDFICTLFREETLNGVIQLFPTNSFAIQTKTGEPAELDVSKHLNYLRGLEIPFFAGFVDQKQLTLRIYSCHHLPALLSGVGDRLKALSLIPANSLNLDDIHHDLQAATAHPDLPAKLRIVHVTTLAANETLEQRETAAATLAGKCSKTLLDIAARISGEYYFTLDDKVYSAFAGEGSFKTFRHNLAKRLLEAFLNLGWILQHGAPREAVYGEFAIYERLFTDLAALGVTEVAIADSAYRQLVEKLNR